MPLPTDIAINNLDEFWKCEHERQNERNQWSSLLSIGIGLWLIPKYVDKYKESQRRMRDVAIRQQNIGLILKDHYLDVTHPQIVFALDSALNLPLPDTDVNCFNADKLVADARNFGNQLSRRYNACDEFGCDNELDAYGAMAAVNATYARRQFNQRRYERRLQIKRKAVQKAHAASVQSPSAFMQLIQNAADIYANLFQNAQTNLAGAVSSFGYGLGGLFGGGSNGLR